MIRDYKESDVEHVLRVWRDASEVAHPFLTSEFFEKELETIRKVHLPAARTLVYEIDGQVAGFIALVGSEIGGLFVCPDRHRGGVGSALVTAACALHPVLDVEVFEANTIGRAFYEKYGFRTMGVAKDSETGHPVLRLRYEA